MAIYDDNLRDVMLLLVVSIVLGVILAAQLVRRNGELGLFAPSMDGSLGPRDLVGFVVNRQDRDTGQDAFDAFAGGMRDASLAWEQGRKDEAHAAMDHAVTAYAAELQTEFPIVTLSGIERDAFEIRQSVRDPQGLVLDGANPGVFRAAVLDPTIRVTLFNRAHGTVTIRRPLANRPLTLYLNRNRIKLLESILGEASADPTGDRPRHVDELWRQFLGAYPGHMQGWSVRAFPAVEQIVFRDYARRSATVSVSTSEDSGETVEFEKIDDVWTAMRITRRWFA